MYFLDVEEFVNYNLFSKNDMLQKCGIDYLTKQEIKQIASKVNKNNPSKMEKGL